MKITSAQGQAMVYPGPCQELVRKLDQLVSAWLATEPYILICITGNKGIGKTVAAKYFRKKGFGRFKPSDIAVIDDDCMSVDVLRIFRRKFVSPCAGIDELQPFFRHCPKKRVRFYVKSNPETRITHAAVVIKAHTSDENRRQRLIQRKGAELGEKIFQRTIGYNPEPRILFKTAITLEL